MINGHTLRPNDPIAKLTPPGPRELFEAFAKAAHGHTAEDAISAAGNLLVNALRQAHGKQTEAEKAWDELSAKMKELLMAHYNQYGRHKGIFPYTQTVEMPLVVNKQKF